MLICVPICMPEPTLAFLASIFSTRVGWCSVRGPTWRSVAVTSFRVAAVADGPVAVANWDERGGTKVGDDSGNLAESRNRGAEK